MDIRGYLQTSLIEWPGKIASVVFVSGCNFRCPFCHNADLVDRQKIAKRPSFSEEKILADLEERRVWVDGVVITGGEPTLQSDLVDFLSEIKSLGFATMIETNGAKPEVLEKLLEKKLLDRISLDVKALLTEKAYRKVVKRKVAIRKIRRSLRSILDSRIEFELRTTVVPGLHDQGSLLQLAQEVKRFMKRKRSAWVWQNFQPQNCLDPKFNQVRPYGKEEIGIFLKKAKKVFSRIELR